MTPDELVRLIAQYRAGIEAELNLLRQLSDVSHRSGRCRPRATSARSATRRTNATG